MNTFIRIPLAASAATGALLLAGCVVAPPYYADGASAYGTGYNTPGYTTGYGYADAPVYAPTAPPAPYVEVQPAIPFAGAIWISGFWNWSGGRYSWTPGRYERPRPGYRWEPRRWSQNQRGGWQLGGGWHRR